MVKLASHRRQIQILIFALVGALLLVGLAVRTEPASASPRFDYPWPDYSVVPVLFVPTDWNANSTEVQQEATALRAALAEVRQFYANNYGGKTFRFNDLQEVQADGPKESYGIRWNGRNIYEDGVEFTGNMEASVVDELYRRNFPTPPAQNESGYSTLIFVKGAGGYAGGRAFPQEVGGWAILGDWAIDSIQGQVPEGAYWWSGARQQTGAAAHELGHSFDLPHPDAYGYPYSSSVMGEWWNYPTIGLNDVDLQRLDCLRADFFESILPTGSVLINNDAKKTKTTAVTLNLSASDNAGGSGVTEMRFSNDGVNWSDWQAYATSASWTLTGGKGKKTVYAEFKDGAGNVSKRISDTIKRKAK